MKLTGFSVNYQWTLALKKTINSVSVSHGIIKPIVNLTS